MRRALLLLIAATILFSLWIAPALSAESKMPIISKLFGYNRSEKEDFIYFRNGDDLSGTVLDDTIKIVTPYGELEVPVRKCAGLSFEGSSVITEQAVTVNFNVFSGIISNKAIKFKIGSSGEVIEVRKEKIKYVLLKRAPTEQDFIWNFAKTNLFVMANGDLITGTVSPAQIVINTDYADVKVSFEEMKDLIMQGGTQPTVVITKKNGNTMRGKIVTEDLGLNLDMGISIDGVYKDKYQRIYIDDGNAKIIPFFLEKKIGVPEAPAYPVVPVTSSIQDLGLTIPIGGGVQLSMRLISAGKFMMGSPGGETDRYSNEGPQHEVTISKSYYIGTYEVTQAQWSAVMGTRPSGFGYNADNPVEMVSWDDCQKFLQKINTMGLGTFRLPTEAEWEYACRAGSTTRFPWGDDPGYTKLTDYAWYFTNSNNTTHPVGQKKSNAWGLYDMHGNVWEWCSDWYAETYNAGAQTDPRGPSNGSYRVLRGGSWDNDPQYCRSAYRGVNSPSVMYDIIGFRLVRTF